MGAVCSEIEDGAEEEDEFDAAVDAAADAAADAMDSVVSAMEQLRGMLPQPIADALGAQAAEEEAQVSDSDLDSDGDTDSDNDQDHVFAFVGRLDPDEIKQLEDQFEEVVNIGNDTGQWENVFKHAKLRYDKKDLSQAYWTTPGRLDWGLKNFPKIRCGATFTEEKDVPNWIKQNWRHLGSEALSQNKVAVLIVATGQEGVPPGENEMPLGIMDIGLQSGKSLLQLFAERVLRVQHMLNREKHIWKDNMADPEMARQSKRFSQSKRQAFSVKCTIPFYVMVSKVHLEQVRNFFALHENFGLNEAQVIIFQEMESPVFDRRGKVMLASKEEILTAPTGSGSVFTSAWRDGVIAAARARGIEYFYTAGIENLLCKLADPVLVGYHVFCRADVTPKLVEKTQPDEAIGVLTQSWEELKYGGRSPRKPDNMDDDELFDYLNKPHGGRMAKMLSFAELSHDMRGMRDDKQDLEYRHGDTRQYVINAKLVESLAKHAHHGHRQHWRPRWVPYVDWRSGFGFVRPAPPLTRHSNAVQLVSFLGDCCEAGDAVCGLLQDKASNWAPVVPITGYGPDDADEGNPDSATSAAQAIVAMSKLHQTWISKATGVEFGRCGEKRVADCSMNFLCEVSPLVSYEGEGLWGIADMTIELPFYLPARQEIRSEAVAGEIQVPRDGGFLDDLHIIGHAEERLLKEATLREGQDVCREGRPLTGEDAEHPGTDDRLDDDSDQGETEAEYRQKQAGREDSKTAWFDSPYVQTALMKVQRHPRLLELDELRKKGKSFGDTSRSGSKSFDASGSITSSARLPAGSDFTETSQSGLPPATRGTRRAMSKTSAAEKISVGFAPSQLATLPEETQQSNEASGGATPKSSRRVSNRSRMSKASKASQDPSVAAVT